MRREDEIRARLEAATPAPWGAIACGEQDNSWAVGTWVWPDGSSVGPGFFQDEETDRWLAAGEPNDVTTTHAEVIDQVCENADSMANLADADLIANAPTDLEYLLGEVERLRRRLAERASKGRFRPTPAALCPPGRLTVGTLQIDGPTTYEFRPIDTGVQPYREERAGYFCPHGGHGDELSVRYYPDIEPPALFVDCCYCEITWEIALAPALSDDSGEASS